MANDLFTMFESPEQVRARIGKTGAEEALNMAQLSPHQLGAYGIFRGSQQLAGAAGEALGGVHPAVERAKTVQSVVQQSAAVAGDDLGKYYESLAKGFKDQGMGKEAFMALQALQDYNSKQAEINLAERRVGVAEKESISGEDRLKVMQDQAKAAIMAAQARQYGASSLKNYKPKIVSTNQIKSIHAQVKDDPAFNRITDNVLHDGGKTSYVALLAQSVNDLVELGRQKGVAVDPTTARENIQAIMNKHVENNTFSFNDFNGQEFLAEYMRVRDDLIPQPESAPSGFKVIE